LIIDTYVYDIIQHNEPSSYKTDKFQNEQRQDNEVITYFGH